MAIIKKIIFLITGTILVVIGALGVYGVIGLSGESSSQLSYLLGQLVLPIALIIIGIFLLAQFYKKPDSKDKVN